MSTSPQEQNLLAAIREALLASGEVEEGTAVTVTAINDTIGVNLDGFPVTV